MSVCIFSNLYTVTDGHENTRPPSPPTLMKASSEFQCSHAYNQYAGSFLTEVSPHEKRFDNGNDVFPWAKELALMLCKYFSSVPLYIPNNDFPQTRC